MDVMTLAAKLTLNTSEFNTSLSDSEKEMQGMTTKSVTFGNIFSDVIKTATKAGKRLVEDTINTGKAFDEQMSKVRAIKDLSDDEFDAIRKKAIELGASTKFTAEQVGEGFYYMGLAGWNAEEMLDGIESVLSLAAASGEDLGRTSDIVTDAITAMGLTAKDAGHFVDVLAAASSNSNTTVSMMGEAFKYLATTGGVLEYSIDDVATTLGLLANNGIKAGQAGTSMRRILNTLINPSKDAAEAMTSLGISLFDPETNARKPLSQVLDEFRQIFKDAGLQLEEGFDPEEIQGRLDKLNEWYDEEYEKIEKMTSGKKKALKNLDAEYNEKFAEQITPNQAFLAKLGDIGGLRGISALFAIMNSTDEDYKQLTEAIANSKGSAGKMAETMLDNLEGDITILNSALEGLKIVVSDDFKERLRGFVQTLTEEVGNLRTAFEQGGLLGMFTNLVNWMITGIIDAVENVSSEDVMKFGEAIGDLLGNLIGRLVTDAPKLAGNMVRIGLAIAEGLVQGMMAGLFGTGEGSVVGMILDTQEMEQDAINEANESATKAKGILDYMDSLKQQYGDAAENTEAWATALEKLKEVYPEINEFIKEESGNLSLANQELMEYIENTKQRQIEEAKRKAISTYIEAYTGKLSEQTSKEIEGEMARAQAEQAKKELIEYIQQYEAGYTGNGLSIDQIADVAYRFANEHGESQETINTLVDTYKKETAVSDACAVEVEKLANEAAMLKTQMELAESALATLTAKAGSIGSGYTTYGQWANDYYSKRYGHAKGLWDVPYDDYAANLHRGEMVLTASQARKYRDGQGDADFAGLEERIIRAIHDGMSTAEVPVYMDAEKVTREVSDRIARKNDSRRYG